MTDTKADTAGGIAGLTKVVESMEGRIAQIDNRIAGARQQRTARLDQLIASLLPSITRRTLDRLKREEPRFVDRKIETAFAENGKILGIFRTATYDAALALMQTQLKRHLESKGLVESEDQQIMQLEAERTKLAVQQAEAMDMLKLIERAHRLAAPLPQAAIAGINTMAQRGRSLAQPSARDSRKSAPPNPDRVSDADLWLWMTTDIPTSFRTLMLDTLSAHTPAPGGGSFGGSSGGSSRGAGAQRAWSAEDQAQGTTPPDQPAPSGRAAGLVAAGVAAAGMSRESTEVHAAAQEAEEHQSDEPRSQSAAGEPSIEWPAQHDPAIATDDRLGAFS